MYLWVLGRYLLALQQGSREARAIRQSLRRQHDFMDQLVLLVKVSTVFPLSYSILLECTFLHAFLIYCVYFISQ